MTINYKKISLIIVFLVVSLLIGYLIYITFFKKAPTSEPSPATSSTQTNNGLPQANTGQGGITASIGGQLPNEPINQGINPGEGNNQNTDSSQSLADNALFSSLNQNGQPQFYNQSDNRFYTLNSEGKLVTLSNQQFFNVKNVTWSANGTKAILEYPDGNNIRYDFNRANQVTLPQHWEDFAFSPDGDKIVAKSIGLDPDNRWLVVANDDGSKAKTIEPLGENGDKVISSWSPNNQSVAFFVDGVDFNRKEVFFIGQNGENFKSIITEGRGFQPLWAPRGNELVYSVYSADNDYKPSLWITGAQGDSIGANRRPLNLNTWANKCSFNDDSLYCAVPTNLERGAGMFPATTKNTQDFLYRINTSTGQRELIPVNTTSSINHISLSADGSYLYYTEGGTNRLKKIKVR